MSNYDEFQEEEFESEITTDTILRILSQAKPHWPLLVGYLIAIALVSGLDSYFTYLGKRIIDEGIIPGNWDVLRRIITIYGGLLIVQALGVFGFIYQTGILGELVRYDLRKKMFNHLQELSFSYFDRTPVGWIISRVTSDSNRIADLVTWGLLDITWAVMNIGTAIFFMVTINWQLALIVIAILPILVFIAMKFRKRILAEYRKVRKVNSKITGAYNENIQGVRVAKALRREEQNLSEFSELSDEMYHASYRAAWLSALFLPTVQIISSFVIGGIVWFSGWQAQVGAGVTVGEIQAFISYITFMLWPIQDLARVYANLQRSVASAERVFSLVDTEPEIEDIEGAVDPGSIQGIIEFDHVDFYYEEDDPVLEDFNLKVEAGETIALVGPTGGGKSTIVNLVARFYEPKRGTIRFDGRDYRELTLHAIQSRIGMVLQTPHLFSGSIRENIRYGRLDATDEEIEEAAKVAGAHDFIVTLKDGYDAEVGEGGGLLSVGQKQLISIARAILAQPEVLIMDEATSSVDTMTESLIQQGMEALMEGRTSFVIAHRLSTIKRVDRILVIEDGCIAEMGTHRELLQLGGHYYRLYTQQFRSEREREYEESEQTATAVATA